MYKVYIIYKKYKTIIYKLKFIFINSISFKIYIYYCRKNKIQLNYSLTSKLKKKKSAKFNIKTIDK